MVGLEALTGDLDDFGFEDYLNSKDYQCFNLIYLFIYFIFQTMVSEYRSGD